MLTKDEAFAVAEFIDAYIFDSIRNDLDWDSFQALRNLVHAYEKCCEISGYAELTDLRGAEEEEKEKRKSEWIPISERLPENDDWVIVTILDERGDTPWRYTDFGWYLDVANCWIVNAEQRTDIIAWMPLPKPWKGENDGRTN